jgi:hypothetical protein
MADEKKQCPVLLPFKTSFSLIIGAYIYIYIYIYIYGKMTQLLQFNMIKQHVAKVMSLLTQGRVNARQM